MALLWIFSLVYLGYYCRMVGGLSVQEQSVLLGREEAGALLGREAGLRPLAFLDDYHFPMVADDVRNEVFRVALQRAIVRNESKVLDVGAGTMLLSMMAMDLGASKVVGVEANPLMCSVAREVLRVNGFTNNSLTGNIRLHEGKFENIVRGKDSDSTCALGQPADILVSETFDSGLIGENFLSILSHAKSNKLIKKKAIIIPNSATIFVQLLESTLSLPSGSSGSGSGSDDGSGGDTVDSPYLVAGRYNLEPMRRHRPAGVYTVRWLDEPNAVRKRLSAVTPLFDFDFQNFNTRTGHFGYTCLLLEVTKDGLVDSVGLWFNLYLDPEKSLVLSNAPYSHMDSTSPSVDSLHSSTDNGTCNEDSQPSQRSRAPCWMQVLHRLSDDLPVRKGDVLRLQVVHLTSSFVFGQVSNGMHNSDKRLVKFIAVDCPKDVLVYAYRSDKFVETSEAFLSPQDLQSEYLLGVISATGSKKVGGKRKHTESFKVFSAQVYQTFKFSIELQGESGKRMGMLYQLPDSTAANEGTTVEKVRQKLPLDEYRIHCPS